MTANEQLIQKFYTAFQNKDYTKHTLKIVQSKPVAISFRLRSKCQRVLRGRQCRSYAELVSASHETLKQVQGDCLAHFERSRESVR